MPGDVLLLEEGGRVPADARLIEANGIRVDTAALTGESQPKRRTAEPVEDGHWLDLPNLVFAGTTILSGHGRAVVFATGMRTEFGKIANLTTTVEASLSPLQKEIVKVTRIVAAISLAMGATFFAIGTVDGVELLDQRYFRHRYHRRQRARGTPSDRDPVSRNGKSAHGETQRLD